VSKPKKQKRTLPDHGGDAGAQNPHEGAVRASAPTNGSRSSNQTSPGGGGVELGYRSPIAESAVRAIGASANLDLARNAALTKVILPQVKIADLLGDNWPPMPDVSELTGPAWASKQVAGLVGPSWAQQHATNLLAAIGPERQLAALAKSTTFPTAELTRIASDLGKTSLAAFAGLEASAAARAMLSSHQLQIAQTGASLARTLDLQVSAPLRVLLDSSLGRYGTATAALRDVLALAPVNALTFAATRQSVQLFNDHLDQLSPKPQDLAVRFTSGAGDVMAGLVGAQVLLTEARDELAEVQDRVCTEVVEPWLDDASAVHLEVRGRLNHLGGSLGDKLDFAWRSAREDSEPARSSVANQVVELLDQVLRRLAPADEVAAWLRATGRTQAEFWYENRQTGTPEPTRPAKLVFATRGMSATDSGLICASHALLAHLLTCTVKSAQKVKHGSSSATVRTTQTLLFTCEGILNLVLAELEE
jgi:hypothetical protein